MSFDRFLCKVLQIKVMKLNKKFKNNILLSIRISVALYLLFLIFVTIQAYFGAITSTSIYILIFYEILPLLGLYGVIKLKKLYLIIAIFYFAFFSLIGINKIFYESLNMNSLIILFENLIVIIYLIILIKKLKVRKGRKR